MLSLRFHLFALAGDVYTSSGEVGSNTSAYCLDLIEMEVNLTSQDPSQRTLHWFVNGEQQKTFITGVPDRVEFAVCCSSLLISLFPLLDISLSLLIHISPYSSDQQSTAR